jgi:hypothetical protein
VPIIAIPENPEFGNAAAVYMVQKYIYNFQIFDPAEF